MILLLLTLYSRPVAITQPLLAEEECMGCILQRQGKLSYIIRRWLNPQTGPDENESFGHCFFCVQCPNQITPSCWGWWPSSPDGGDYEGDDGKLQPDRTENWDTAACRSLSLKKAEKIMDQLEKYEANHDYQVINDQGTSCLGFCEDMATAMNLDYTLPMGDLTLTGNMRFPTAPFVVEKTEDATPTDLLFFLVETASLPLSKGNKWPPDHLKNAD